MVFLKIFLFGIGFYPSNFVLALAKFRGHSENKDELEDMKREHEKLKSEPKVTVRDVFTNKYLRKVTIIAIMLMVMQQLSGINAVSSICTFFIFPQSRADTALKLH